MAVRTICTGLLVLLVAGQAKSQWTTERERKLLSGSGRSGQLLLWLVACSSLLGQQARKPATNADATKQGASAQTVVRLGATGSTATFQWILRKELVQAISQNAAVAPKIASTVDTGQGLSPAIVVAIRQQGIAAQSLMNNKSPIGPSQTTSASGTGGRAVPAQRGLVGSGAPSPAASSGVMVCVQGGIWSISGHKTDAVGDIWFTPSTGYGPYTNYYVVQGCGFDNQPGEVYLSNLRYPQNAKATTGRGLGVPVLPPHPDQLPLRIAPNNGWSDRQVVAYIDPNASGYYDTPQVLLVVKTADGHEYKTGLLFRGVPGSKIGLHFVAARAPQLLTANAPIDNLTCCPEFHANSPTYDSKGGWVTPYVGLGVGLSELFPGNHTVIVLRQDKGATFPGGTDRINAILDLMDEFVVKGIQMHKAGLPQQSCVSNGTWGLTTQSEGYHVSWQEQSCTSARARDVESFSAYALDITVEGPRGVPPWRWQSGYK